ncbi:MAG: hypothetical protein ABIK15_00400 [Pseudomonadota bacterium]
MEISKEILNASPRFGNLPGKNGAQYSVQLFEKARADTESKAKIFPDKSSRIGQAAWDQR